MSLKEGKSVKEIVEELEQKYGGLRAAGRALDMDWQILQRYKGVTKDSAQGKNLRNFLTFLEKARVALKIPHKKWSEKVSASINKED